MLRSDHRELRNKIENEIDVVDVFSDWFLSAASYPSLRQCWWRRYWWPGWTRRGSLSLREQAVDADSGGCLLISSYLIQVVFFSFLSLLPLVKNPTLTIKCMKLNRNRLHKKKHAWHVRWSPSELLRRNIQRLGLVFVLTSLNIYSSIDIMKQANYPAGLILQPDLHPFRDIRVVILCPMPWCLMRGQVCPLVDAKWETLKSLCCK